MSTTGLTDAILVRSGRRLVVEHAAAPEPGRTEVTFAVQRAGICGTDRQIVQGLRDDRAAVLGHEGVAEVAAVGPAVDGWRIGERVVFNPVNPGDQDEILGHSTPGIFRRFFTIDEGDLERRALAVRAPADLPLDACVLAEPLGTVLYTRELLDAVAPPAALLIIGSGALGVLHALHAQARGVPRVELVCSGPERAAWLRRDIVPDTVRVTTFDRPPEDAAFDAVLFCAPARATAGALALAIRAVAPEGRVGLISGVDRRAAADLPGLDLASVRRRNACGKSEGAPMATTRTAGGRQVSVFGHRGTAPRHLSGALRAVEEVPALRRVLTHRVSLDALPRVFAALARRSELDGRPYLKAVVDCTGGGAA